MSGLWGVFIIILKVDCMHIAQSLKQFQNVMAQNLSIVLTNFRLMLCINREENSIKRVACVILQVKQSS